MSLLFSTEPSIASTTTIRGSTNTPGSSTGALPPPYISQRSELKRIAAETMKVLKVGSYTVQSTRGDIDYDLRRKIREMRQRTRFYHPNDPKIMRWAASLSDIPPPRTTGGSGGLGGGTRGFTPDEDDSDGQQDLGAPVYISVFTGTTIEAVRSLTELDVDASFPVGHIGVLTSACASQPGGNLLGGSNGQELSLARSSTLYASLVTDEAKKLYTLKAFSTMNVRHTTFNVPGADTVLNTHGMVYTPGVTLFRDDLGRYVSPVDVDILTCAAVPAHTVRAKYGPKSSNSPLRALNTQSLDARQVEALIQRTMRERMARILFLFALRGVRSLILPAFGTGAFGNSPAVVARLWARLLSAADAPFARVFDRVVFAVLPGPACDEFGRVFGRDVNASNAQDDLDIGPSPSSDNGQGSTHITPTHTPTQNDSHEEPEKEKLEQYARALGTSLRGRPSDMGDQGSSQDGQGKGKQRATCEDADEDSSD